MRVKREILFSFCTLLVSVFYPASILAHPQINEFSSPTSEDWIELYNPTDEDIVLDNYRFRDSTATNKLELSGTILAKGHIVFEWSDKLNNPGDNIKLVLKVDDGVIEEVGYGDKGTLPLPEINQTLGRKEDGLDEWVLFSENSKGISNNPVQTFSTPTPTPSPIPTPTRTPTPINTPTPTRTPTPTKALSPAVLDEEDSKLSTKFFSNNKESKFKPSEYPEAVLSTKSAELTNKEKPFSKNTLIKDAKDSFQKNKITSISVIVGAILLICCGILIFHNQRKSALF